MPELFAKLLGSTLFLVYVKSRPSTLGLHVKRHARMKTLACLLLVERGLVTMKDG